MLLKISLGLAILVGVATLYFTMGVGEKINGLNTSLAAETQAKTEAEEAQRKAQDGEKKAKAANEETSKQLAMTTNALNVAVARATEQEKRANKSAADLVLVTEERNEARQELSRWRVLGIPPERVLEALDNTKRLEAERAALNTDLATFSKKNRELEVELLKYRDPLFEPPLPAGTRGKIVAVDPKYDFVVLDIGGNQGLITDAKMLVNRNGKLVAKVKITHVEPNRAIANIMPDWKVDDVLEGDSVVY